jgi:hypothetical protein
VRLRPCVAQSLHLSARAGRSLLLCASPKRKTAWLNSGGPILRVALRGIASHLHTILDQIRDIYIHNDKKWTPADSRFCSSQGTQSIGFVVSH